jgi:carbon-monoxide dehydrogenase medium subunit
VVAPETATGDRGGGLEMNSKGKFIHAESLDEALEVLANHGDEVKVVAGGTALTLMLEHKLIEPKVLLGIGSVPGLDYLEHDEEGIRIGSLYSLRSLERSEVVSEMFPALAHACASVGNVRVRNQATLGGNLAEADYASDPPTVLSILDAEVSVTSQEGTRTIPLSEFFYGFFTTAIEPEELITSIYIPSLPADGRSTYLKYKSRSSEDRPCVGVAAMTRMEGGVCKVLRVAIGAACEIPTRLEAVEAMAADQELSDELIAQIAEGYAHEIETLEDLRGSAWYRKQMIRVHVKRALVEVRNGHR